MVKRCKKLLFSYIVVIYYICMILYDCMIIYVYVVEPVEIPFACLVSFMFHTLLHWAYHK